MFVTLPISCYAGISLDADGDDMTALTFTYTSETPFFLDDAIFQERDPQRRTERLFAARAAVGRFGDARWDYDPATAQRPDWWANGVLWQDMGVCQSSTEYDAMLHMMEHLKRETPPDKVITVKWIEETAHSLLKAPLDIDLVPILREIARVLKVWVGTAKALIEGSYPFARGKVYGEGQPRRKRGQRRSLDGMMAYAEVMG
jgi:hypothetical protein